MIDVAKLRALLAAATPGPWTEDDGSLYGPNDGAVAHIARHASMHTVLATGEDWKHADAALIAAAVNALPDLLTELETLRADLDVALAEARDEGHAAGRAEALEHIKAVAADHYEAGHFHEAEVLGYALRALAGKL